MTDEPIPGEPTADAIARDAAGVDVAGVTPDAAPTDAAPAGNGAADAVSVDVGDVAADYIEGLLDICDLDGDIDIEEAGGRTTLVVTAESGTGIELLADPETVTALQDLARLAVQARTGEFARLTLDIGGSRDQRTRELTALVEDAAARLADGNPRVDLEPMSSYERKVVHDLVAERGLVSASEGDGQARHTVVTAR